MRDKEIVKSYEEALKLPNKTEKAYKSSLFPDHIVYVIRECTNPSLSHTGGDYTKKIIFSPKGWMYTTSYDLGCCPKCGRYLRSGTECDVCGCWRGEWQPYPSPTLSLSIERE